jgi:hypothetical protein
MDRRQSRSGRQTIPTVLEVLKALVFVGGWIGVTAFLMVCVGLLVGVMRILRRPEKESTWRDVVR